MNWYVPAAPEYGTSTTLFRLLAADMNSVLDQALEKVGSFTQYIVDRVIVTKATAPITNAKGGIYSQPAKAGVPIVMATQAYSGLDGNTTTMINPTLAESGQIVMMSDQLYLSLTSPQGGAANVDIYVMGIGGA